MTRAFIVAKSQIKSCRDEGWALVASVVLMPAAVASDYGTTGLIDTPTARMKSDGTFSTTGAFDGRNRQFAITYQATPWLEGTYRYSGWYDKTVYTWDRNYEFKALLWDEDYYVPAVAVGIRDLVGTGVFGSEYVVANKRFGRTDVSFGLGWGRLAGEGDFSNPARLISSRFDVRNAVIGEGGELSLDNFFSGPEVGVFGGVSHQFSQLPLTAIAEYNPDQYDFDVSRGGVRPKSPISVGLKWDALPGVAITTSYQHGEELGVAFQFSLDSTEEPLRLAPNGYLRLLLITRAASSRFNKSRWYDRLLLDVERSGLILVEGSLSGQKQAGGWECIVCVMERRGWSVDSLAGLFTAPSR